MVEDVFYQHPQVLDAVVVGQPDAYAGEIPVVYVQPKAGERLDAQELMAFVAEHALERAAIPKHCRIVPAIPQSSVGKILRPEVQLWAIRDGVMDCVQSVLQARASHFTAKDNTDAAAEVGAEAAAEVGARAAAETEAQGDAQLRSEERRVGKDGKPRGSREPREKNRQELNSGHARRREHRVR